MQSKENVFEKVVESLFKVVHNSGIFIPFDDMVHLLCIAVHDGQQKFLAYKDGQQKFLAYKELLLSLIHI